LVRAFSATLACGVLAAAPLAAQVMKTEPDTTRQANTPPAILVAQIDQNCGVFRTAIQTEKPYDVAEVKSSVWKVVQDADLVAAEKTHSFTTYAKVWKQAGNYVWIHSVTTGSGGGRHATQMCFRTNGTLARVRQALSIPALDTAAATAAYYRQDGSLIQKSNLFEENDPAIAKKVAQLPYFKNLP
jgi:cytochrome c556